MKNRFPLFVIPRLDQSRMLSGQKSWILRSSRSMILLIFLLCSVSSVAALDRCQDYVTDIRIQHTKYFGLNYPWWYGVGQARQESNCRANVTAFDAGMGLTQFMPRTWAGVEKDMGVKLDPYNPEHSIRAQAFYMCQLHRQNWEGSLWLTYQAYNGGWKLLRAEKQRACHTDWTLMKQVCHRKVIRLKSGRSLDLCEVNYDYSKKVFRYGNQYRLSPDNWRYW
ncbi:MAG: lytic transglycosylase domain-containing protein [Pseudomonadota bacterium]